MASRLDLTDVVDPGGGGRGRSTMTPIQSVSEIVETMEQVLVVNSGRCLSSALSRGGVEKLSERLAKFLNHRSIHRDKQTQQECAALYVNTALGLNLANTKKDMQDWITTRIAEARLYPALLSLVRNRSQLERQYEAGAFFRDKVATRKLLKAAKQLDELDTYGLAQVAVEVTNTTTNVSSDSGGEDEFSEVSVSSQSLPDEISEASPQPPKIIQQVSNTLSDLPTSKTVKSNVDLRTLIDIATSNSVDVTNAGGGRLENGKGARTKKFQTHKRSSSDSDVKKTPLVNDLVSGNSTQRLSKLSEEENHEENSSGKVNGHRRSWSQTIPPSVSGLQNIAPPSTIPEPRLKDKTLINFIASESLSQGPLDQDKAHIMLAEAMLQYGSDLSFSSSEGLDSMPGKSRCTDMEKVQSRLETLSTLNRIETDEIVKFRPHSRGKRSAGATALSLMMSVGDSHLARSVQFMTPDENSVTAHSSDEDETDFGVLPSNLEMSESHDGDPNDLQSELEELNISRNGVPWTPPRPQLILHTSTKKKKLKLSMEEQNLMCHDCGMQVEAAYFKYFRYCHYFGKYSCTTCHTNQSHSLPSKVIYNWDFDEYKVSDFARTLLTRMSADPLFDVETLNPRLLKKVGRLRRCLTLRTMGAGIAKYLRSCRLTETTRDQLGLILEIGEPEMLSLDELRKIRFDNYDRELQAQVDEGSAHVRECYLCQSRAFFCEVCINTASDKIKEGETCHLPIFPFDPTVIQCQFCYACYHKKCYEKCRKVGDAHFCTKCDRIKVRTEAQKHVKTDSPVDIEDM